MKVEHRKGVFAISLAYGPSRGGCYCGSMEPPRHQRRPDEMTVAQIRDRRIGYRRARTDLKTRAQWMSSQAKHAIEMAMAATEAV